MTDLESLPIRAVSNQKCFTDLVDQILSGKKENLDTDMSNIESQIDLMVYKLYELTYDEALLVDPELEKLISREDYEKASIEELAVRELPAKC